MTITANSSIALDVHSPKKDAVLAVIAPTVGANDVAIWIPTGINLNLQQSIVGDIEKLKRFALTTMKESTYILAMPSGGGDGDIAVGVAPIAGEIGLYIGTTVGDNQQSHFLDRTVRRIVERWLEESK